MESATEGPRYSQPIVNGKIEDVREMRTQETGGVSGQNESSTSVQPPRPPAPPLPPGAPYGSPIRSDAPVLRRVDSRTFFPAPPQQRPSGSPNFQPQNWARPPSLGSYRPPVGQNVGQYRPQLRREEESHNYNYESQQNYSNNPSENVDRRKSVSFNPNVNQPGLSVQPRQVPPGIIRRPSPWALLKEKIPTDGRGQFIAPGPRPLFEFRKMQSDQSQIQKTENDSGPNPNTVRHTPPPNMSPQNPMYNGRIGENMRPMPPGMMGKPLMQPRPPSQEGRESPVPQYQGMQRMMSAERKPPPEMVRTDSSRNLDQRMNSPQERGPTPNTPRMGGISPGPPRAPKPPGDDDDDVITTPERMNAGRGTPPIRPQSGGRPVDASDFSKTYTKIQSDIKNLAERNSKSPASMMRPESRLSNDGRSPLSMDNRNEVKSGPVSRPPSGDPSVTHPISSDRPPSGDLSGSRPVSGDIVGSRPETQNRPLSGDVPPTSRPPSSTDTTTRPASNELRKSSQSYKSELNETPPHSPNPDLIDDKSLSRQSSLSSQVGDDKKETRNPTPIGVTSDIQKIDSGKVTPAESDRPSTPKTTPESDSGVEQKTDDSQPMSRTDTPTSHQSLGSVTPIQPKSSINSRTGTLTPNDNSSITPNPKSIETSRNTTPNPLSNNTSGRGTPTPEEIENKQTPTKTPEKCMSPISEKDSGKIERPKSLKRTPSRKGTPDILNGSPESDGRKTPSGRMSRNSSAGKSKTDDRNDSRSPLQRKFSLKRPKSGFKTPDGDHDSGVDETTQGKDVPTTNGDLGSPNKSPSKIPAPKRLSMPSPTKSTKGSPKTPEAPSTAEKKKVPMNKVQVGAAPSPNLKTVRSKIGSLENTSYKPGGGKVKIENRKVDFSHAQPRIAAKNDTYTPGGGDKKITQVKLTWNAKSKIGSLDNAAHKPGGGDKKIESMKLDFKDKAKPKIGSKDNIKHQPGGGTVKSSDDGSQDGNPGDIEEHRLEIKAESKVGSMDNVKHKPGGGEKKIFDDKEYIKQMSSTTSKAGSEGIPSGTQIEDGYCSSNTSRKTSRDRRQTSETRGERQTTPTSLKTSPNEEIKHQSLIEKHAEKQKQTIENGVEVKKKKKKIDKKQTESLTNGLIEHSASVEKIVEEVKQNIIENAIKEENEITNGTTDVEIKEEEKNPPVEIEEIKISNGTTDIENKEEKDIAVEIEEAQIDDAVLQKEEENNSEEKEIPLEIEEAQKDDAVLPKEEVKESIENKDEDKEIATKIEDAQKDDTVLLIEGKQETKNVENKDDEKEIPVEVDQAQKDDTVLQKEEDRESKNIELEQETDVKEDTKEEDIHADPIQDDTSEQNIGDSSIAPEAENKVEPVNETIKIAENVLALNLTNEGKEKEVTENINEDEKQELSVQKENEKNVKDKQETVSEVKSDFIKHKEDVEDDRKSLQSSPLEQDLSNTADEPEETDHNSNQTNGDGPSEDVDKVDGKAEDTTNILIAEDLPNDNKTDTSKQEINLTDDDKKLSEDIPVETEPTKNDTSADETNKEINAKENEPTKLDKTSEEKLEKEITNGMGGNETNTQDVKLEKAVPCEPAEMTEIERIVLAVAAKLREDEENERIRLDDIIAANKEKLSKENLQKAEETVSVKSETPKIEEDIQQSKENEKEEAVKSDTEIPNTDSEVTEVKCGFDKNIEKSTTEELEVLGGNLANKSTKEQKAQEEKEVDSKEIGTENKTDEKQKDNQTENVQNLDNINQIQKVDDKIKQSTQFDTNIIKTLEVTAMENQIESKINTNVDLTDESGKSKSSNIEIISANVKECSTTNTGTTEITSKSSTSEPTSQNK